MDLTLEIIIWCIVIWLASKFFLLYLQSRQEILREEIKALSDQRTDKIIQVDVEKYGSVFYLYEKDTRRFIAQGSNIGEIKKKCADRFKDAVIIADSDVLKQYGLE
jgi:hypothetical protein